MARRPVIFLDCDGTLSALRPGSERGLYRCRFRPSCMRQLNRIVRETRAAIVVSSAWRYAIHGGAMSPLGFEIMLRAAGGEGMDVVAATRKDAGPGDTRGQQCRDWLDMHGHEFGAAVALDDDDDFEGSGVPLVQTDSARGLTEEDATLAIAILVGASACPSHTA